MTRNWFLTRWTGALPLRMFAVLAAMMLFALPELEAEGVKVNVNVDTEKALSFMSPVAVGVQTDVSNSGFMTADTAKALRAGAVTSLRYPGIAVSGVYHWSRNTQTNWQGSDKPNFWIPPANHFGNFVALLNQTGAQAIITVNYGSNLAGTGGGEPAEAAAWVAYANGDPNDPKVIGKDSTGYDWKTVGYWATMRASAPLADDDGFNFLRITHPRSLHVTYWEIGSEVYANGYYGSTHRDGGSVEDLHFRYSDKKSESEKIRSGNRALGPAAYGESFVQFAHAMKSVDPNIKVGLVLVNPQDNTLATDWNPSVLKAAGRAADFLALQWRPTRLLPPDWKEMDVPSLLNVPTDEVPVSPSLLEMIQKNCGPEVQIAVTDFGLGWGSVKDPIARGLFAADAYLSLMEAGFVNASWGKLHDGYLNDKSEPTPAYFGMLMTRILMMPRDVLVSSSSNKKIVAVHAAKRADGSVAILLVNKDPKEPAVVNVNVKGMELAKSGMRFDYGPNNPPNGTAVVRAPINEVGNVFTISVPAYTITAIRIPKAQ
jgi:hypothetical protein